MDNILDVWEQNPDLFKTKSLSQILSFTGDGKLSDSNATSQEFRQLLQIVPTEILRTFVDECLTDKFENNNGGYALQDIINQIGIRLGFEIEYGLYRGRQNSIGFDGIWTSEENYSIVVEVKTTDVYRINLDVIAEYRNQLIEKNKIIKEKSSILIVVGRQDTGDLEAQIRGSRHAWDIRLLSSDSLINLLTLKEALNDIKTVKQINEILKPNEYTKLDKLIDLIFLTSKDIQISTDQDDGEFEYDKDLSNNKNVDGGKEKQEHVNVTFNDACIEKIQRYLKIKLVKETRASFTDSDKNIGVISIVSKIYTRKNDERYWFGFHPHQRDFLKKYNESFVSFGCGSDETIFVMPFNKFEPLLKNMNITEKEDRMYWHVVISNIDGKYFIHQPLLKSNIKIEISEYKI
ncbi:MAG: hypothetical protein LBS53_11340 [Synergistaceae bacterium]|jgi:hypothetical protein|nr:hypothetical protein [Synergistaceae bacterium]